MVGVKYIFSAHLRALLVQNRMLTQRGAPGKDSFMGCTTIVNPGTHNAV